MRGTGSGNKLSHLDGEILLKLVALHSIHLSANAWRCDCRLRKLVRLLRGQPTSEGALIAQRAQQDASSLRANSLQDEPECEQQEAGRRRLWSSMSKYYEPPAWAPPEAAASLRASLGGRIVVAAGAAPIKAARASSAVPRALSPPPSPLHTPRWLPQAGRRSGISEHKY